MAVTPEQNNPFKGSSHVIYSANCEVRFTSHGAQVAQWEVRNPRTGEFEETLYVGSEAKRAGSPLLCPGYQFDIPTLRKHGFGRDSHWTTHLKSPSEARLTLHSKSARFESGEQYPKPFQFKVTLTAEDDGSLTYEFLAKNLSDKPMLDGTSIHPYFPIPHADKNKLVTEGIPGFVATHFDWDKESPDNTYTFDRNTRINARVWFPYGKTLNIKDETEGDQGFDRIQVWSQNPSEDPNNYNFVCVEPIGRLVAIKPGEQFTRRLRMSWEFPKAA